MEILHGLVGLLHIVLDIAAVDVSFHHLRVPLHRPGVVILGAVEQARLLVDMSGKQREVRLFGKHILVG